MSFLAPWMFGAGVLAAVGVLALHLLTTRRPPPTLLPTARFVPESEVRAVARASRPTDLLLLALRALAVLLIGAAFARPVIDAPGPSVRSVIAAEWTSGVQDIESLRATLGGLLNDGDALVLFDSAARVVDASALDTLSAPSQGLRVGALSPMFVAVQDAAQAIARGADSVRLVVVATLAPEGEDAATRALRSAWPGRVDLRRIDGVADTSRAPTVVLVDAAADDVLAPALPLLPAMRGSHEVRIVRRAFAAADSLWVSEDRGRVLVSWPVIGELEPAADGLSAGRGTLDASLVAPLARMPLATGHAIARWRDGDVAATERALGAGCVRRVGVGLPSAGDLTLRAPFTHFLARMVEPCGGARSPAPADSTLAWLAGDGPLAVAATLASETEDGSPFARWLLLAAVLLLALEQLLRRRPPRSLA